MKIIRFRKVKELAQSYTDSNSQRHELNTILFDTKFRAIKLWQHSKVIPPIKNHQWA